MKAARPRFLRKPQLLTTLGWLVLIGVNVYALALFAWLAIGGAR